MPASDREMAETVINFFEQIERAIDRAHKIIGAPGDWGYETPLGKAIVRLYEHRSDMANEREKLAVSLIGSSAP